MTARAGYVKHRALQTAGHPNNGRERVSDKGMNWQHGIVPNIKHIAWTATGARRAGPGRAVWMLTSRLRRDWNVMLARTFSTVDALELITPPSGRTDPPLPHPKNSPRPFRRSSLLSVLFPPQSTSSLTPHGFGRRWRRRLAHWEMSKTCKDLIHEGA